MNEKSPTKLIFEQIFFLPTVLFVVQTYSEEGCVMLQFFFIIPGLNETNLNI